MFKLKLRVCCSSFCRYNSLTKHKTELEELELVLKMEREVLQQERRSNAITTGENQKLREELERYGSFAKLLYISKKVNYAKHGCVALALKYLHIACLFFLLSFGIVNLVILICSRLSASLILSTNTVIWCIRPGTFAHTR